MRRTDRVSVSLAIRVSGETAPGHRFTEKGEALVINAHGAAIVLARGRKLEPGQEILIHCALTGKEAAARVVGQIKDTSARHIYGVALADSSQNPWQIGFPPITESENAFLRVLLECSGCRNRELLALNELEAEVYGTSGHVSKLCKHCSNWTIWSLALHNPKLEDTQRRPRPRPAHQARKERKHLRLPLKITACIRHAGLGEEIVEVENLSRGGLLFLSPTRYKSGAWIEVAAPYTPGAANVFVLARIVRHQDLAEGNLRKYGAEYMKDFDRRPA